MAAIYLIVSGVALIVLGGQLLLKPSGTDAIIRRLFHTSWLFMLALALLCTGAALLAQSLSVGWLVVVLALALVVIPVRTLRLGADRFTAAGMMLHRLCGLMGVLAGGSLLMAGI